MIGSAFDAADLPESVEGGLAERITRYGTRPMDDATGENRSSEVGEPAADSGLVHIPQPGAAHGCRRARRTAASCLSLSVAMSGLANRHAAAEQIGKVAWSRRRRESRKRSRTLSPACSRRSTRGPIDLVMTQSAAAFAPGPLRSHERVGHRPLVASTIKQGPIDHASDPLPTSPAGSQSDQGCQRV